MQPGPNPTQPDSEDADGAAPGNVSVPDTTPRGAGNVQVLYSRLSPVEPRPHHFDPVHLERAGQIRRTATGRGHAWFVDVQGHALVLRHYRRGGLVGRFNRDRYLWTGLERSRPARELRLTEALFRRGLPVPRPAGARVVRTGPLYRGDLLTHELPETRTLAERIRTDEPRPAFWTELGRTLRRFHDAGAHHTDLNVRNLLVDDNERIFLIDWDKGRLRTPGGRWARRTLDRLERSLLKESELAGAAERHWPRVLEGWKTG